MAESEFLTVKEFAEALKVSPSAVRNWIHNGTIKAITIGRTVRIPKSELERLTRGGGDQ
jgi:excisionase family DNA binding protein